MTKGSGQSGAINRFFLIASLAAVSLFAQQPPATEAEQESLQQALAEAGNSPVEFVRALESHLKQYPDSPRKAELERALVKTAIDLNDDRLIIQYGERVLAREPDNFQFLQRVATALLHKGDQANAERALIHIRHCAELIDATYKNDTFAAGGGRDVAKRKDESDRAHASILLLEARAQGLLGHADKAIQLSQSSYAIFPSVEAAREAARWLSSTGKDREALQALADAFTIAGLRSADPDGANDRARMSELYKKLNGSEAGLGDLILKAYDNTSAALANRRAELRLYDPNTQIKDPMQFTLLDPDGNKLALSSLLGKVVVLDFWATWCGPCRIQHPLYDEVKKKFKDDSDVVFLSINTDEDHALVKPFLENQQWTQKVFFDGGLMSLLQVTSIPTTIIFGKKGELYSRLIGFLPERFVEMLSERIEEATGKSTPAPAVKGALIQ